MSMKKNTILILNWRCPHNPLSGGAERVTLEHAKAWVKDGYSVFWIAGNYKGGKREEVIEGVQIYRRGTPVSLYILAPFLYWTKWRGCFDLVVDEIHGVPFLSPLWAWKSKKLAFIHEVAQEIWDEMLPFPINIVGKLYERLFFNLYKNIPFLTASASTKRDLIQFGIREKNISVIPHGLFIKPVSKVQKKEKNLTLLFVSRLVKMKGIEDAIRICFEVTRQLPTAQVWIVGKGGKNYIHTLHSLIKKLHIEKSITFFGYVTEKEKITLYRKAHFLIHTSVREGFGLTAIEAHSQGTPTLVYDSPGLHDIVENGVNGYTFAQRDYKAIAQKSISLFKSAKYEKLATSTIQSSKKYNWKIITNQGLELIRSILENK